MPIYRSVIGQAHIALDKMTLALIIPGKTKIVGYSTDSIQMKGPYNICDEAGKNRFLISVSEKGLRKNYYESYGPDEEVKR